MKKILYLTVASAFIGTKIFAIDIKLMHLSLYRMGLFIMVFYLLMNSLLLNKSFSIKIKDRQSLIIRFYFLWMIYAMYSLAWALDLKSGIRTMFFLIAGFLCICIFSAVMKEEKDFKNVFNIMYLMVVLHNALGWFEIQTCIYFFADLSKVDRRNVFSFDKAARVPITLFTNTNDFATFMTFGVFISFIIFMNTKKIWLKVLSSGTIVSSIMLIMKTGSRGNLVGVGLGICAMILLVSFKNINKYIIILFGMLGFMFFLAYFPLNQKIISLIQSKILSRFGSQSMSIKSDGVRFNLIRNGFLFLTQTIGFGTGVGNIEYWMAQKAIFDIGTISNMHNWWMEILVGYGIIIFLLYIFIYLVKLQTFIKAYLKSENLFIKNTSLGIFGFMMAYVISSVSSSSNMDVEWIWVLWGVIISFIGYIIKDLNNENTVETN